MALITSTAHNRNKQQTVINTLRGGGGANIQEWKKDSKMSFKAL